MTGKLSEFEHGDAISLLDCNLTKKPDYSLYVIDKLQSSPVLDFKKLKHKVHLTSRLYSLFFFFFLN